MAAIALLRLHHYTENAEYRDKAEQTLETFAGVAEQFGIFAATYGIAVVHLLGSPTQVVVIAGDDRHADALEQAANAPFAFTKVTLRLEPSHAVSENLPPILGATIPHLPQLSSGNSFAVLCSGRTCQPPVHAASDLRTSLQAAVKLRAD